MAAVQRNQFGMHIVFGDAEWNIRNIRNIWNISTTNNSTLLLFFFSLTSLEIYMYKSKRVASKKICIHFTGQTLNVESDVGGKKYYVNENSPF